MAPKKSLRVPYPTDHGTPITLETVIGTVLDDPDSDRSFLEVAFGIIATDVPESLSREGQELTYHVADLTVRVSN